MSVLINRLQVDRYVRSAEEVGVTGPNGMEVAGNKAFCQELEIGLYSIHRH